MKGSKIISVNSNFNSLITSLCETHQTQAMSNELKQIQTGRIVYTDGWLTEHF